MKGEKRKRNAKENESRWMCKKGKTVLLPEKRNTRNNT